MRAYDAVLFGLYLAWLTTHSDPVSVQQASALVFWAMAAVAYADKAVNVMAYCLTFALALTLGLVARSRLPDRVRSQYDTFSSFAAVIACSAVAFYAISPKSEGALRPVGLAVFLLFALPLLTATRGVRASSAAAPQDLQVAWDVCEDVYSTKSRFDATEFVQDTSTGTRASVTPIGTSIYVAFAGSENKTDWLKTDANVKMTDFHGTRVHAGFEKAWESVKDRVIEVLQNMNVRMAGAQAIVLTGHSLGGALATLGALDIIDAMESSEAVRVISFGSPQVGDLQFVKLFDETVGSSTRVVTVYDPVPKVLAPKFAHVKGEYILSSLRSDTPLTAHGAYGDLVRSSKRTSLLAPALILAAVFAAYAAYPSLVKTMRSHR